MKDPRQPDRSAQAFMGSSEIRACLHQHGFHKESLCKRVLHDAVKTVDNRPFLPVKQMPKFIDGMTMALILSSLLGDADSRLQMSQSQLSPAMPAPHVRMLDDADLHGRVVIL